MGPNVDRSSVASRSCDPQLGDREDLSDSHQMTSLIGWRVARRDTANGHDRICTKARDPNRPAVEALSVTRAVEERGHRLFLLIGVGPPYPLGMSVREGHVEGHSCGACCPVLFGVVLGHEVTIRNRGCGSIEHQPCELTVEERPRSVEIRCTDGGLSSRGIISACQTSRPSTNAPAAVG